MEVGGVLSIVIISVVTIFKLDVTYFSLFCIPFSFSCLILLVFILRMISKISKTAINGLVSVGKISFVIYLTHMQIAGIINRHMFGMAEHFKVVVAFGVSCILVFSLKFILHSYHKDGLIKMLGFR